METYEVEVSSIINSRADVIYSILADYHTHHPKTLPVKYFKSLRVKQGGIGEGTVIQVEMQIFGKKQNLRMVVSEP